MGEAALLQTGQHLREVHLAGAGRDLDLFRWTEILYAHAGHDAIHSRGVVQGVEFTVGVVEYVSGVVPEAKVLAVDPVNNLAAQCAVGVGAAVRFHGEADAFGLGVIATLGYDFVVGIGVLLVRPPEQQVWTTAGSGILDEAFESVGVVGGKLVSPKRNNLKPALLHFCADCGGFLGCRGQRDNQVILALGRHQARILEARGRDTVERDMIIILRPRPLVSTHLPARCFACAAKAGTDGCEQRAPYELAAGQIAVSAWTTGN